MLRITRPTALVLLGASAAAQTQLDWIHRVELSDSAGVRSASFASDGRSFLAGTYWTSIEVGFVRAVDPLGQETWTREPQVAGAPLRPRDIVADGSGALIVAGGLLGGGAAAAAYDEQGNALWTATWVQPGGHVWSAGASRLVASNGRAWVSGTYGHPSQGSAFGVGAVALDQQGQALWIRGFPLAEEGGVNDLAVDAVGNLYVLGTTTTSGLPYEPTAYAAKFGSDGTIAWIVQRPGDTWSAIATDRDGLPFLTGTRGSDLAFLVAGLDPATGAERFAITVPGGTLGSSGAEIGVAPTGEIVATGLYGRIGTTLGHEGLTLACDARGGELWRAFYNRPSLKTVILLELGFDTAGDVLVGGMQRSLPNGPDLPVLVRYPRAIAPEEGWVSTATLTTSTGTSYYTAKTFALSLDDSGAARAAGSGQTPYTSNSQVHGTVWRIEPVARATCVGDGTQGACPCGNASAPTERAGCVNSLGNGGKLEWNGNPSLAADTFTLHAVALPASTVALYLQGSGPSAAAVPFGDGLLCLAGPIVRMRVVAATGGRARNPEAGSTSISVQGSIGAAGSVSTYQVRYRNAATFCTSAAWNLTNAVEATWQP